MSLKNDITGLILAGGEARRMGGDDKGLIKVNNKPMIEYVVDSLKPQTENLMINANRNHEIYQQYVDNVIADDIQGFHGPLAGMLTGLKNSNTNYLLTAPCDSPLCPNDIAERMLSNLTGSNADISVATDGERMHPVFCLLKKELYNSLENYINSGKRKIDHWFEEHRYIECDFSDKADAFLNINTPEDIKTIEKLL